MSEPLYRRIVSPSGRVRYEPAGVAWPDVYPEGDHLVVVEPGWRSTRYGIVRDHAALIAAASDARQPMLDAIVRADVARIQPDTERHRRAWRAFLEAGGDDRLVIARPSRREIVDAALDALVQVAAARKVGP